MFNTCIIALSLIPVIMLPLSLSATEPLVASKASVAPIIDGKLDEAVWKTGLKFTDFKTYKPD
jgi:hypothetical protein